MNHFFPLIYLPTMTQISHVAQVSNTTQVTRQVSLLGLSEWEQGRKLVVTFLLHIICCIGLCTYLLYNCLLFTTPGYNYYLHLPTMSHTQIVPPACQIKGTVGVVTVRFYPTYVGTICWSCGWSHKLLQTLSAPMHSAHCSPSTVCHNVCVYCKVMRTN